jgi:outer membrane protein assembly factor BamE
MLKISRLSVRVLLYRHDRLSLPGPGIRLPAFEILTGTTLNFLSTEPDRDAATNRLNQSTMRKRLQLITRAACAATLLMLLVGLPSGCVYQIDVQQGNKLEPKDVESVKVGMTRNQVRFLLGTPMVTDVFHKDRWDYFYYFRAGRSKDPERRWLIVWFNDDVVREIQRDVEAQTG